MSRELLDRLLKVIGMLSSSNANEAGVAAMQMMAMLKRDLIDIWDFQDIVANGFRQFEKERRDRDGDEDDWRDVLRECMEHFHRLSPREQEFLGNMRTWRGTPTSKQEKWLLDILNKARRFQ
jgi:hypothetical protein